MKKIYPERVRAVAKEFIDILTEEGFFQNEFFTTTEFAEMYVKDVLTEKFIAGEDLDMGDFEEMNIHLDKIICGSVMFNLKNQGFVDSYEDENVEELFFITQKGKDYLNQS